MSAKEESNPFYCDDEDDDNEASDWVSVGNGYGKHGELKQVKAKIKMSEGRQLDSLRRTHQVLLETEDVGHRTAEVSL